VIDPRTRIGVPLAVAVIAMAIYVPMLSSGVSIGDAAEAQTVPAILGIAHPTGFPAYTLGGWLFAHLIPFGTIAWRINAFAALGTAASAGGIAAIALAIGGDAETAAGAALVFAFGSLVWHGALVANAQIAAGPCEIAALYGALVYARAGAPRALILACAATGIGIAAHPSALWLVPAIAVAVLWQRGHLTRRTLALAAFALVLPLSLYAYLPIRSTIVAARGLDPSAGPPLRLGGGFDWDTNTPRTLDGFLEEVLARREGAGGSLLGAFDPRTFPDALRFWFGLARVHVTLAFAAIALAGIVALALHDRRSLSVLAAGTLGGIAFAFAYATDAHIDRYVFFSFAAVAVAASAAGRLSTVHAGPVQLRHVIAIALAVLVGTNYAANRAHAGETWLDFGEPIVAAVARDTPPDAIVVAQWNDAAALGYGAYVEHALGSRLIVSGWPSTYADRYVAWSRARPVILYVSRLGMMRGLPYERGERLNALPSSLPSYRVFEVRFARSLVPFGRHAGIRSRCLSSNEPPQRFAACGRVTGPSRCANDMSRLPADRAASACSSHANSAAAERASRFTVATRPRWNAPAPI
jgi:hypothetical protein